VVPLAGKTDIADHMVVATGTSQRHIASMADKIRDRLKEAGIATPAAEGLEEGGSPWILIDAGDVIVHLFRAETRAFYDIEKLWSVAPPRRQAGGPPVGG
jgi:ribosome-associated protein